MNGIKYEQLYKFNLGNGYVIRYIPIRITCMWAVRKIIAYQDGLWKKTNNTWNKM